MAFCARAVVAAAASTPAADQVVSSEKALPVQAAELAAQVGVDHHLLLGLAPLHRRATSRYLFPASSPANFSLLR